jgi:hypothetical protein
MNARALHEKGMFLLKTQASKRRFSPNHRLAEREDGNGVGDWPRTCSGRIEIWWPEKDLVESRFVEKG